MILEIRPLSAGNALHLTQRLPVGARLARILRKATNDFTGHDDSSALVAYEGLDVHIVDAEPGLVNETAAWYRAYYLVGAVWQASDAKPGTPRASYDDLSTDVQALVRDRLEAGLAVEVARGDLKAGKSGAISVKTAPPVAEETGWPVVTVELAREAPGARGIGETLAPDFMDPLVGADGVFVEQDGWLSDWRLNINVWALNSNERLALRKAVRRLLIANLPVFDAAGMVEIVFEASDNDFLQGEFGAPVFQTSYAFSCQAPTIVTNTFAPVAEVEVTTLDIREVDAAAVN